MDWTNPHCPIPASSAVCVPMMRWSADRTTTPHRGIIIHTQRSACISSIRHCPHRAATTSSPPRTRIAIGRHENIPRRRGRSRGAEAHTDQDVSHIFPRGCHCSVRSAVFPKNAKMKNEAIKRIPLSPFAFPLSLFIKCRLSVCPVRIHRMHQPPDLSAKTAGIVGGPVGNTYVARYSIQHRTPIAFTSCRKELH